MFKHLLAFALSCTSLFASFYLQPVIEATGLGVASSAIKVACLEDGRVWVSNEERVNQRFLPASTAKIPHTFIALEEGYEPESFFEWDGKERFKGSWNQHQTLSSAYNRSCVWVYQSIVQTLGRDVMSSWIQQLDYGNQDIGATLGDYWLDGPLKISIDEQINFLTHLIQESFPFSQETYAKGKKIMERETQEEYTLYAKKGFTGTLGWYCGWVEKEGKTYIFSTNMDIGWADLNKREEVVKRALDTIGL